MFILYAEYTIFSATNPVPLYSALTDDMPTAHEVRLFDLWASIHLSADHFAMNADVLGY